jgi:PAS domain S-box-containing protein
VLDTHPIAVTGAQVFDNLYYLPPDQYLSPDRTRHELELRLHNLRHHRSAEQSLLDSENRYRQVLENLRVGVVVHAPDTRIALANPRALELLGLTAEQALGTKALDPQWYFLQEDGRRMPVEEYPVNRVLRDRAVLRDAVAGIHRPGGDGLVWVSVVGFPLFRDSGELESVVVTFIDITERRAAEESLKRSLIEKEVLLREIHHRVKNNLQVISSLLSLQANKADSGQATDVLRESVQRVRSMALVHEKLYESGDLANVDLGEYIEVVTREFTDVTGASERRIRIDTDVEVVPLAVDQAVPCGLIVSELLSNALKHAFPDGRPGTIRVSIRSSDHREVQLQVADDGVGLPPGAAVDDPDSLGLWLVKALATQLDGRAEFERPSDGGTVVRVTFTRADANRSSAVNPGLHVLQ